MSFGILLTMIANGSTCALMSDGDAISDIGCNQWVGNICPVDFSIDPAESVLSWMAGWRFRSVGWWFHDFDGGSVLLTKIDRLHASKIRFSKNHRGQTTRNAKRDRKSTLSAEIRQPGFPESSATMGSLSLSVAISRPIFQLFCFFFLLYFSWHLSSLIDLIFLRKTDGPVFSCLPPPRVS